MSDDSNYAQATQMPIGHLQPNPMQPRGVLDDAELKELIASITLHGILEPIVVAHTPAGYQIIAGERRWKAAKLAGLTTVPVIVKETTPRGMLEMAIVENVQRVDLNPLDRAKALARLVDDFHLTTVDIAERIGKSSAYISNTLRLLTLPEAIQDGLLSGAISEGHARALITIEDTRYMVDIFKQVLRENASVRRTEFLARCIKAEIGVPQNTAARTPLLSSPIITRMQEKLEQSFGEGSDVKIIRSRAQTRVTFIFKGDPEKTQLKLNRIMKMAISKPLNNDPVISRG